jgi:hypothetical protein
MVTHLAPRDPGQRTISLSFVALERSIEVVTFVPGNSGKLPVWTQTLTGRTKRVTSNIKRFEGMRTPFHQRRCQQKGPPGKARQGELPEVNTAREGRQSTDEMFHSSLQMKLEGPSKHGWGLGLGDGRNLILFGIVAVVGRYPVVDGHIQVLEKGERKDKVDNLRERKGDNVHADEFDDG